jgi:hypothetical protein
MLAFEVSTDPVDTSAQAALSPHPTMEQEESSGIGDNPWVLGVGTYQHAAFAMSEEPSKRFSHLSAEQLWSKADDVYAGMCFPSLQMK